MAQRTLGAISDDLDALLGSGAIVRTHPMRPPWHFVLPEDLRWLLALTGPRVPQANGTMYRREGRDDGTLRREEVMGRAVEGG